MVDMARVMVIQFMVDLTRDGELVNNGKYWARNGGFVDVGEVIANWLLLR